MSTEEPDLLISKDDAAIITAFATKNGLDARHIIRAHLHALADHIAAGKPIGYPVVLGYQAPLCLQCPFIQPLVQTVRYSPPVDNVFAFGPPRKG